MRVIKFNENEGRIILKIETLEDLWTIQRILFVGDLAKSKSLRKFKTAEGDKGEMKEVVILLNVEKIELDKNSERLRIMGKIIEGKPLEYIKLNGYHTLNIAPGDILEIRKSEWHNYILDVVKNAVSYTKKPKLGIIAIDDEKALPAYLLGYGIEFKNEIYNRLSKRMSQKEFREQEDKYNSELFDIINNMDVDTVIVAGPGFTKDNLKKYFDDSGMTKKLNKRLIYLSTSNAERSGIYELIKSDDVAKILHSERIRQEFLYMDIFLKGLSTGRSKHGVKKVEEAIKNFDAETIIVNDSALSDKKTQEILKEAEQAKIRIEVFNSDDEVGTQLHFFNDIACF